LEYPFEHGGSGEVGFGVWSHLGYYCILALINDLSWSASSSSLLPLFFASVSGFVVKWQLKSKA
jgi:hypothetical protein